MKAGITGRFGLVLGVIALMLAPAALAAEGEDEELLRDSTMQGDPTTPSGDIIAPIYEKIIWASIAVFVIVAVILTYILIRFRKRRGHNPDVPQIHGNSKLEIAWTIGPALVMFWLLVISYNGLLAIDDPDAEPEVYIDVEASRFLWTYTYADGTEATGDKPMRVQEDTWVQVNVTSVDVIHAFAVPGLDVMIDANPGRVNSIMFHAREPGTYLVQCRQFCGTGHGEMLSAVEVFEKGTQTRPFGEPVRAAPEAPPETNTTVDADRTITVDAFDFGFDPAPLADIEPGETVQVVMQNIGNNPHNLYIGDYDLATNEGTAQCEDPADETTCWTTDFNIGPGGSDSFVFTAPDEPIAFDLWCDIPGHAQAGMLTYASIGGAEPEVAEGELTEPRLPAPGAALVLGALAVLFVAARRRN